MGKDAGFYMVIRKQVTTNVCKIWCITSLKYIIRWMSRPQNWSKMIQNTMFMAHMDTTNLSTKTCISQTASDRYHWFIPRPAEILTNTVFVL